MRLERYKNIRRDVLEWVRNNEEMTFYLHEKLPLTRQIWRIPYRRDPASFTQGIWYTGSVSPDFGLRVYVLGHGFRVLGNGYGFGSWVPNKSYTIFYVMSWMM